MSAALRGAIVASFMLLVFLPAGLGMDFVAAAAEHTQSGKTSAYSQPNVRVNAQRIARQIFNPGLATSTGEGFFSLAPDGRIFVRPVTQDKINRLNLAREIFRLSIRVKLRQRQAFIKRARAGLTNRSDRKVYARPLSEFFTDMFLEPGDAVTADSGVYIFRGAQTFPFSASDFVPLSRWKGNQRARNKLRALERRMKRSNVHEGSSR